MSPTADAFLRSWPWAPGLAVSLLLSAAIYQRGWRALHRRDPRRWHGGTRTAFFGGLVALFLALGSPIEPFASLLLQVHMIQHMLLMMAAPPLLWLGRPLLPMVRGLPRPVRVYWVAPVLRSRRIRRAFAWLAHPAPALVLYVATTWFWHIPAIYESALRSATLHRLQHGFFLGTALLFWFVAVRPYPFRPRWSAWVLVPYLLVADVSNTVLSALLTFSERVLYPHYGQVPRIAGIAPLDDQSTAGVIMWVPGSVAFLLPLFAIGLRLLFGGGVPVRTAALKRADQALTILPHGAGNPTQPAGFDLLRLPVLGRFLRWRHARLVSQLVAAGLAGVVIADGLYGTQVAAMNLAGVLPWTHWRGLAILGLLAAGNVSCMACPFQLPRTLGRRWLPARLSWPRRLRSKWLGVALVALFFWSYEAFAPWDSPRATAWIVAGYFAFAFAIDGAFRGAAFCKYLCPIGQFNFVQSSVSPLEVKVRDPAVCQSCRTKECIRGTPAGQPGCELDLYLPQKAGNLDCTFCLDCVHACPHDNVGILPVMPGGDLWDEASRSGVGRLEDRPDLAALVLVVVFAAFANAAGMVAPVVAWQEDLARRLGLSGPLAITTAYYLLALVAAPALTFGLAAVVGTRRGEHEANASRWKLATRSAYALVPIGFSMWLAHYGFHLATGWRAAVPAAQRAAAASLGWPLLGTPAWGDACCRPVAAWMPRLEIVCLDLGLLLSLYCGSRIARAGTPAAWRAFAFWALVTVALFATGVWIVLQPMQMRGTLARAG